LCPKRPTASASTGSSGRRIERRPNRDQTYCGSGVAGDRDRAFA
jgi:hypothetical protein